MPKLLSRQPLPAGEAASARRRGQWKQPQESIGGMTIAGYQQVARGDRIGEPPAAVYDGGESLRSALDYRVGSFGSPMVDLERPVDQPRAKVVVAEAQLVFRILAGGRAGVEVGSERRGRGWHLPRERRRSGRRSGLWHSWSGCWASVEPWNRPQLGVEESPVRSR
jgi:hypothetical protein